MWNDMEVDKTFKNKKDNTKVDVVIYFDKRDSRKRCNLGSLGKFYFI